MGLTVFGDEAELDGVLAGEHVEEGKGEFLFVDDYYVMSVYYYYYWAILSGHRYVPATENDNNRPSVLFQNNSKIIAIQRETVQGKDCLGEEK